MTQRGAPLGVRLRIDLAPGSSIGPGKIALLEHIEASGSLSKAARELGMSYRRAWLLLDDLNHALGEPVSTASVGGAGGGGARLTEYGRRLIAAYRDVEHASHDVAAARLAWLTAAQAGSRAALRAISPRPLSRPIAARSAPRAAPGTARPSTRGRAGKRSSPVPTPGGRR
jgi:molybdate transport system regulatory protein